MNSDASQTQPPRPVASLAEADLLIRHMVDVMRALLGTVEEETALVRGGRLSEASRLEAGKAELSRLYMVDCARIKASQGYLARIAPGTLADLHKLHDRFRALLQMKLTVLAAAQAITESAMRGIARQPIHRAIPAQARGVGGRTTAPVPRGMLRRAL